MGKEEFLQGLRQALAGEVPQNIIAENLNYYNSYISGEVSKGRTEEEVIEEIGSPRLIAKTIIDSTVGEGGYQETAGYDSAGYTSDSSENTGGSQENPFGGKQTFHMYNLNTWYAKLILTIVLVAIVWVVFTVVGGLITIFAPVLVPILMVMLIMWFMKGFRR